MFPSNTFERRILTADYSSVIRLEQTYQIISITEWQKGQDRKLKLTQHTVLAFKVSTCSVVGAGKPLLADKDFEYMVPAIFADEELENFSVKPTRGGNLQIFKRLLSITLCLNLVLA